MKEIEKKYLVTKDICLDNYEKIEIEQSYLNANNDPIIRLRKCNNNCYLTYKSKIDCGDRKINVATEYELPLSVEVYEKLLLKREYNIIKKDRYLIPIKDNLTAELDIYHDNLEGLKTVEVEFKNIDDYKSFKKPKWFGKDITDEKKYINSQLSKLNNINELGE